MTVTAPARSRRLWGLPATLRVVVALAAIVTIVLVGLAGLFASPASAQTLTGPGNAVGAFGAADGQAVGAHQPVLAGQCRARAPSYDPAASGSCVAAETASGPVYDQMPLFVDTPGGIAVQSTDPAALAARDDVLNGADLFKGGNVNSLPPEQSQFFATESPDTPGYGERYGIPAKNLPFDWISSGQLEPGAPFITRPAPRVGANLGGGTEVVTWPRSFIPGAP